MIINIVSTQINRNKITGPKKVLDNTLKGFDKKGIKYVFNKPINEYKYNWIHDDQKAIIEAGFIGKPVLVGPNTAVLPKDLPIFRKKLPKGSVYLHPSCWTIDIWNYLKFNESKLDFWAVGIDTDEFNIIDRKNNNKILLYFKQRDLLLLDEAQKILKKLNIDYVLIHYGFYKEEEYKKALKECKFGIWIGCSESQGIGLQEALATGLPLIVLDAISLFDTVPTDSKNYFFYEFPKKLDSVKTSTAPYFDERCGMKIEKIDELENTIKKISINIDKYNPRKYIEENLTLEKSAKKLVDFFDKMDIKDTSSYNYQKISMILFYFSLLFQKWAWKWAFGKLRMNNRELRRDRVKFFLSRIIRDKIFYTFWKKLNKLSMYGMNFGVSSGYADYSGELHIIKTIKKDLLAGERGIVFDVGANIGDWSKFIIEEYAEIDYKLYMFEPSLLTYNQLISNIDKKQNQFFFPIGFGDKKENLKIFYDTEGQGSASILMKEGKFSEDIQVDTIDDFCKESNIDKITFLKMDVQGYEYNILIGAKGMIDSGNIKYIQFEFDEPNIENRIFFKDFWELLSEKYEIFHSLYNGLVKVEEYHYELENFRCMNYLAILKEGK